MEGSCAFGETIGDAASMGTSCAVSERVNGATIMRYINFHPYIFPQEKFRIHSRHLGSKGPLTRKKQMFPRSILCSLLSSILRCICDI